MENKSVDCSDGELLLRFEGLIESWEAMTVEEKQHLQDQTSLEITMEHLKKLGLVDGEGELEFPIAGMLYGYARAKGFIGTPVNALKASDVQASTSKETE